MIVHEVRVHPSAARLPREAQLTWKIAELAPAAPPPEAEMADMVSCRVEAFLSLVHELPDATPEALSRLNPPLPPGRLHTDTLDGRGIFDHGLVVTDR